MLDGGTYLAPNGSVVWKGLGFSANGPYDCAFALSGNGSEVGRWLWSRSSSEGRAPPLLTHIRLTGITLSWTNSMRVHRVARLALGCYTINASRRGKNVLWFIETSSVVMNECRKRPFLTR